MRVVGYPGKYSDYDGNSAGRELGDVSAVHLDSIYRCAAIITVLKDRLDLLSLLLKMDF